VVNDPGPNGWLPPDHVQDLVEPSHRLAHPEQGPRLLHRGDDRARGEHVPADVTATDCLPAQRVSAVVSASGVEDGHPAPDRLQIVADLGRPRSTNGDLDGLERL